MERRASGTTADLLFFALMITVASLLLLQARPLEAGDSLKKSYAKRLAQSTLLTLQQTPVHELGDLSYELDLSTGKSSKRILRQKTPIQLISEDVLLNPRLRSNGRIIASTTNREFDEELTELLRRALDEFVEDRFGYRLIVRTSTLKVAEEGWAYFRKVVANFDESSEPLCSEGITLDLIVPNEWMKGLAYKAGESTGDRDLERSVGSSERKVWTVTIVLELWSN